MDRTKMSRRGMIPKMSRIWKDGQNQDEQERIDIKNEQDMEEWIEPR